MEIIISLFLVLRVMALLYVGDFTNQPTVLGSDASVTIRTQSTGAPGSGNRPQVYADLSAVTGVDINTVRQAFALQRFEEARARYGARYT